MCSLPLIDARATEERRISRIAVATVLECNQGASERVPIQSGGPIGQHRRRHVSANDSELWSKRARITGLMFSHPKC